MLCKSVLVVVVVVFILEEQEVHKDGSGNDDSFVLNRHIKRDFREEKKWEREED